MCNTPARLWKKMMEAPILQVYDPTLPAIEETDASQYAIGAALLQTKEDNTVLRPVAYFSEKLKDAERKYAANE